MRKYLYLFAIFIGFYFFFSFQAHAATIGFDASSSLAFNSATTTFSWSHNVTSSQSNLVLFVNINDRGSSAPAPTVSGVSYNGQALTRAVAATTTNNNEEIWYLVNPPTGTHTVSTTLSGSAANVFGVSASFYNVAQTNTIDVTAATSSTSNVNNATTTLTTTVANDDTFEGASFGANSITPTGNAGQVIVATDAVSASFGDAVSYATTSATGAYSQGFKIGSSFEPAAMATVAFEPSP
jgi:hypothetical protein